MCNLKDISFPLAFSAGMLSFVCPCVLSLLPSYISFITGISFKDITSGVDRKRIRSLTIKKSATFISGFSVTFIALGTSLSVAGKSLIEYQDCIRTIGGIVVIIFGLFVAGLLKFDLLMKEKRIQIAAEPGSYIGSFLIGVSFAAGWSPCIGPILGTILIYAGSKASAGYGLALLSVYSLGLAIPFFLSAIAVNLFLSYSKKLIRHMQWIKLLSGSILVVFGIMLLTDNVRKLPMLLPI